jgi:hypothetical protein
MVDIGCSVFARIRPSKDRLNDKWGKHGCRVESKCAEKQHSVEFEQVFCDDSNNEVYEQTSSSLVNKLVEGYSGCIMLYGQTGSGKTFTVMGENGLVSSSVNGVISALELEEGKKTIFFSVIQVYGKNTEMLAEGLLKNVDPIADLKTLLAKANTRKRIASTTHNVQSSRAHTIYRLDLIRCDNINREYKSRLDIVDLGEFQAQ